MARVLEGSYSFTCTHRVYPLTEWTVPAFAFPAEAGTHLPTRTDGLLSWPWVAGWLHTKINVRHRELNSDTVAHLSTNRARRRLTSLIEANALTTTPDHQTYNVNMNVVHCKVRVIDLPAGNCRSTLPRSGLHRRLNDHQASFCCLAEGYRVALLILQQCLACVRSLQHYNDLGPLTHQWLVLHSDNKITDKKTKQTDRVKHTHRDRACGTHVCTITRTKT